jgi:hypothetical protein
VFRPLPLTARSFDTHINPLFRKLDRDEIGFVFDLWAHQDVKANAEAILERLEDRSMPCDAPWEDERIQLFRAWIEDGCLP